MTDLSRESRDVIEAGARALAPSDAARAKIRAAVAARVSGAPGTGGEGPAGAGAGGASVTAAGGPAAKIWLATLLLGGIAAAVLGVRWYLGGSSGQPATASAPREAEVARAPAPSVKALPRLGPPSVPPSAPTRDRPRVAPRARDAARPRAPARSDRAGSALELEVALLSEARRALADGASARALAALGRHRREIGAPQMGKEAALLRAEALCAADRAGEGLAVLAEVEARWPGAAGAAAVRAGCGAD